MSAATFTGSPLPASVLGLDELDEHGELRRSIDPYDPRTTGTNFDLLGWLATFDERMLANEEGRRTLTVFDPFLFAFLYLRKHMTAQDGSITFADAHFLWVRMARRWIGPPRGPREGRRALVAPRSCAKSSWFFLFLPMWAGVHRHVRFVAAFADSGSQAELHLATFKQELAGNALLNHDYPDFCAPARRHTGRTLADNQNMLHTKSGFTFVAKGIDSTSLGMKMGEQRPDLLICHEVGTPVLHDGRWIPVEEHPSFQGVRESESRVIDLWGLPFPEVVTPEHRYWAKWFDGRRGKARDAAWVEADQLDTMHYIGAPIDMTEAPAPPVPVWRRRIADRGTDGRITGGAVYGWELERLPGFDDPEFWWLVGLWWGDGHLGGGGHRKANSAVVGITVAYTQVVVEARLRAYLTARGSAVTTVEKSGCRQLSWSWADLAGWLRGWKSGNSRKEPPAWVERLPLHLQRALIEGYVDADGYRTPVETRITSIHLPGLLVVRRILARLGIAATIRKGAGPRLETFPNGRRSMSRQKYDLRWTGRQKRYAVTRTHIKDGMLWSKVRKVTVGDVTGFAPIKTESGQYETHFGISHNCDDIEPPEANYSPFQREKRLSTLQNAIMPLNELAKSVVVVGTVTMPGSIVHELVRHAKGEDTEPWVNDERFKTHHTRAIVTRPDGTRRSVWPGKWPLDYLESIEHTRSYKLNYDNDPKGREGDYWNEEDIRYGVPPNITRQFLFVDPPVTMKTRSDPCGLVVLGYAPGMPAAVTRADLARNLKLYGAEYLADALVEGEAAPDQLARLSRVCVLDAWEARLTGSPLKKRILEILGQYPKIEAVVIENNQGGDLWVEVMNDLPVKLVTYGARESKETRFGRALDYCQKRRISFAKVIPALEDQLLAFPRVAHEDVADAFVGGSLRLLAPRKVHRDGTITPR